MSYWTAQPGPQSWAAVCPAKYIFFGGARGGGKTDTLVGRQVRGAQLYGDRWNGLMVRRKYKDLARIRARIDEMIRAGLPATRIGGDHQPNVVRFANGANIWLSAFQRLDQADDEQSKEYTEISLDEACTIPFVGGLIEKLKGCLRSSKGVPCKMVLAGNPGGPGHSAIKALFIDGHEPLKPWRDAAGQTHVFIPSRVYDNRILMESDPEYEANLRSIRDPALRAAWLDGSWEVFPGQAFHFERRFHVLDDPPAVPITAPLLWSFDWGWGAPFSMGWWWEDGEGRLYRFAEWYGWTGTPDEGLRMKDTDIAAGIQARERELGIWGRSIRRVAGHDCFATRADYTQAGGHVPSTAETFAAAGIFIARGNVSRRAKIQQFRERIGVDLDANGIPLRAPMLLVYPHCHQFIRTIPALVMSDIDKEDVDTDQEDHVYDEAALACTERPIATREPAEAGGRAVARPVSAPGPTPEMAIARAASEPGRLFEG